MNRYAHDRPQSRLGIIHLLGWITGVAMVLAGYRAVLDAGWLGIPLDQYEATRWWQLGYGLAYGAGLSTLGLLVWRRLRGDRCFPSHPGHWLLVFGGLALMIDAAAFVVAKGVVTVMSSRGRVAIDWFWIQQSLGWGIALVVGLLVLARMTTNWHWRLLATLITLAIGVNWLTNTLVVADFFGQGFGWSGTWWLYYLVLYARAASIALCLVAMPLVLSGDRGEPRDWLHWVGVAASVMLGVVDFARQVATIVQWL